MATMDVLDDAGMGGDQAAPGGPAPTGSPPPARRSPERDDRGVGLALLVGFVALVGLFLAVAAIVVAFNRPKEAAAGNSAATVDGAIRLSEFAIEGDLTLPPGHVQLTISNTGSQVHNLEVLGVGKTTDIQPGQSTSLHLGQLAAGKYQLRCNIVGHADSGMTGVLTIDESAAVPAAEGESAAGATHEMSWAEMDKLMLESIAKFPAATEGHGNQPLAPTVAADGAKEFALTASVLDWEVSPGKTVQAWAYNGQVPGPIIKVAVGDHVRIKLTNDLPAATDVHSHGISLPNEMDGVAGITQAPIEPGQSFTYDFVAEKTAVGMYHAHLHGDVAVPNGLFGAFLIGDVPLPTGRTVGGISVPADLKVTQELPMVLNDAGAIGLSLNGKSFPATEPIAAKVGDWIEVHYMNEGLQSHPMHPHQFPQLIVARDGIPLDQPYWSDTLSVAPGERYTVLMHLDRPGTWVWHCHILNHVESEQGMFGMVTAMVVT
jgi:FtsP/CotA-like multicopper oxidase with cupredoxin domain